MQYKEWLNEWLELYVRGSKKERTYRKYRGEAEKYLLPALGGYEVEGLTAVELQRFSVSLSERHLAANTLNGIVSVLKASLKRAVALGVAPRQYADAIVRAKGRETRTVCFGKAEQRKIERYILGRGTPALFGIVLCLYTGLRIGELLALTWEDVDLARGTLAVTRTCRDSWVGGRYKKEFGTTKTQSSERTIPLPKQIVSRLRELKKSTGSRFVVPGRSADGAQIRSYQRTFARLLAKLGIAHRGFHALRHTFATRALEVGMDVRTLAEILGHKNPTLTLRCYAHSMFEHKAEMMNKVGRLLKPSAAAEEGAERGELL